MNSPESRAVAARYARRDTALNEARYSLYANAAALQAQQERLCAMVWLWKAHGWASLGDLRMLEVGCGGGGNLQDLLRLGAAPQHLTGLELLPTRVALARNALPGSVNLREGDACCADIAVGSQDAVLLFTVFSSLLDEDFRRAMAQTVWHWVKPGGGVLVYDFVVDNPRNPDVRAVPLSALRALFPHGRVRSRRLTLAPPLARRLPHGWIAFASLLLCTLRTHRLTWITKP